MVLLCNRCCCGRSYHDDGDADEDEPHVFRQKSNLRQLSAFISGKVNNNETNQRKSTKIQDVVANKNRPVDIISFLGNDLWIIDDTMTSNNDDKNKKNVLLEDSEVYNDDSDHNDEREEI